MSGSSFLTALAELGERIKAGDHEIESAANPEVMRQLAVATNSGGSGRGMSYYLQAARCGRKAILAEQRRAEALAAGHVALNSEKHALAIGSLYHLMQQQAHDSSCQPIDFAAAASNVNVSEALRMFRGWMQHWGRNYWGTTIAVEERCAVQVDCGTKSFAEVSGAFDMVVELTPLAASRAASRFTSTAAPGPGRYIVDWKTADGESNGISYMHGVQALWYPALYNLTHDDKVDGIIFDVVMKRGRRRDRAMHLTDFAAYFVATMPKSEQEVLTQLKPAVTQGHLNVLQDRPNRLECVDWRGDTCPFFNNGCEL